jgi:hypothetical protein
MHITQGLVELDKVKWNAQKRELSGEAIRAPGEQGAVHVYVPAGYALRAGSQAETVARDCVKVPIEFAAMRAKWAVRFGAP